MKHCHGRADAAKDCDEENRHFKQRRKPELYKKKQEQGRRTDECPPDLYIEEFSVLADRCERPGIPLPDRKKTQQQKHGRAYNRKDRSACKGSALPFLQDLGSHTGTQKNGHIEPSGVIVCIHGGKSRIQKGNEGHPRTDRQKGLFPAFAAQDPEGKYTGHCKAGQIERKRAVPDRIIGKQRTSCDQIRHHEKRFQDRERCGRVRIGHQIVSAQYFGHPRIAQDPADSLYKEKRYQHKARSPGRQDPQDLPAQGSRPLCLRKAKPPPDHIIQDQEQHLPEEEIIVDDSHQGCHQNKTVKRRKPVYCAFLFRHPPSFLSAARVVLPAVSGDIPPGRKRVIPFPECLHKAVRCQQIERKKRRRIVKMLKDDIARLKARESIEKPSEHCRPFRPGLRTDPGTGTGRSKPVFQRHQKRHHIRQPALRERDREPEKRTSPQIKGKRSAHVTAQIHQRIPEKTPLAHCAVGEDQKGDLLDIIIPVIKKQTSAGE